MNDSLKITIKYIIIIT